MIQDLLMLAIAGVFAWHFGYVAGWSARDRQDD